MLQDYCRSPHRKFYIPKKFKANILLRNIVNIGKHVHKLYTKKLGI